MIWLPIPVVIVLMIIASVFWVIGKASQGAGAVKKKQNAAALRDAAAVGDNTAATGRAALTLAGQLSRAGDTAQARQHYETAAGCTHPEISAQAWAALGVLAFNAKAWDEAARDLRSAIALGSTKQLPGAGLNLGMVERNAGRFDDAIAAFRQVVDLHAPSYSARAMYNLGALYSSKLHDDASARIWYQQAIDTQDPGVAPESGYWLATLLLKDKDMTGAVQALHPVAYSGHKEWGPRAALSLGKMYADSGDAGTAATYLRMATLSGHQVHATAARTALAALPSTAPV